MATQLKIPKLMLHYLSYARGRILIPDGSLRYLEALRGGAEGLLAGAGTDVMASGMPEIQKLALATGVGLIAGYGTNRLWKTIENLRSKDDFKFVVSEFDDSQFIDTNDNPRFLGDFNKSDFIADTGVVSLLEKTLHKKVERTHDNYSDIRHSNVMTSAGPLDLKGISDFSGLTRVKLDSGRYYFRPGKKQISLPYYFNYHGVIRKSQDGLKDVFVADDKDNPGKEWFSFSSREDNDEHLFAQKKIMKTNEGKKTVYTSDYLILTKVRHPFDRTNGKLSLINYPGIHDSAEFGFQDAICNNFEKINEVRRQSNHYQAVFEVEYKYPRKKLERTHGLRPQPKSVRTNLIDAVPLKEEPAYSGQYRVL